MYAIRVATEYPAPVEENQNEEKRSVWQECLLRLLSELESRDVSLRGHSDRVGKLSLQMASSMGLSRERLLTVQLAALLHDIGKLKVPPSILDKPGKLTRKEFLRVKHHAEQGELILKALAMPVDVCRSVRCHHERYNGRGYPDGLTGQNIPVEARILGVADAFDAMTVDRPYRTAMETDCATRWIRNLSGVHFDPDVVDCFLSVQAN